MANSSDRQTSLELWQVMLNTFFRLRQSIRPVFAEHGLTGPQWRVFRMIGESGGEGLTPGQISEALHVTPGNTTGVVDKLVEAGLVQRHPHAADRRALLIAFTARGAEVYRQLRPAFDERVAELFRCLQQDERREMIAGLQRLLECAEQANPSTPDDPGAAGGGR